MFYDNKPPGRYVDVFLRFLQAHPQHRAEKTDFKVVLIL